MYTHPSEYTYIHIYIIISYIYVCICMYMNEEQHMVAETLKAAFRRLHSLFTVRKMPLLLMDKILHDPKYPKLWELWYIPYSG